MSNEQIKELLGKLQAEIRNTGLDEETREMVRALDADIHDLIDPDSEQSDSNLVVERAKELEDSEVVDALGNEARAEIRNISAALQRIDAGEYGVCVDCGNEIDKGRIRVHPYAKLCIECARLEEERSARYS